MSPCTDSPLGTLHITTMQMVKNRERYVRTLDKQHLFLTHYCRISCFLRKLKITL